MVWCDFNFIFILYTNLDRCPKSYILVLTDRAEKYLYFRANILIVTHLSFFLNCKSGIMWIEHGRTRKKRHK